MVSGVAGVQFREFLELQYVHVEVDLAPGEGVGSAFGGHGPFRRFRGTCLGREGCSRPEYQSGQGEHDVNESMDAGHKGNLVRARIRQ